MRRAVVSRVYRACVVVALVTAGASPAAHGQQRPLRSVIDEAVQAAWQREGVTPAEPASDAEFLRRVYLDLVGTIPAYDETVAFLADGDAAKRERLIDRLLDDPRFAAHQADVWDMVLFGRNPPGYGTDKRDGFRDWLTRQFAENRPYDQWVRDILRARGNTVDDGAPMYFVQYKNRPEDATVAVTQTFLGVQLQCARCHDHPFESWTQLDFYGMAAFFARLQVVDVGKKNKLTMYAIGEKNTGDVLFTGPVTEQEPGKKGEPVGARFLHGEELEEPELPEGFEEPRNFPSGKMPPEPKFSRKDQLAEWVTTADNPYFARAVANRVWAQFMGHGLVHPVDNLSESNEPSHPDLLSALAERMAAGFDLKACIRELCNSRTYQLSSAGPVEDAMPQWFQRARVRPLSAEELIASWRMALQYDATQEKPSDDRYAPLGSGYLLRFFGKPSNGVGDFQGGLHEHLYMNNGGLSQLMTTRQGSLHYELMNSDAPWPERIGRLFLTMLSRPPLPEEQERFTAFINDTDRPQDQLQQAIWVLMTCSEFRFNH